MEQGVEPGPEGKEQDGDRDIASLRPGLRDRDEGGKDVVLLVGRSRTTVEMVEQCRDIGESRQRGMLFMHRREGGGEGEGRVGAHEALVNAVPAEGHWTPAVRPGVQRLVWPGSGRRAPLDRGWGRSGP